MPLDLLLDRPVVFRVGGLPEVAQLVPVAAAQGDAADREEPPNPKGEMTRDEALVAERELGKRLQQKGFCVYGAH